MRRLSRTIDLTKTGVDATGIVGFTPTHGGAGTIKKIPTRGQYHWALTSKSTDTATAILKGTNNPDPADTSGETLITNTHGAANQQDGSAASKGYKYVFVHVTALAAVNTVDVRLHGTGYSGLE